MVREKDLTGLREERIVRRTEIGKEDEEEAGRVFWSRKSFGDSFGFWANYRVFGGRWRPSGLFYTE